MPCPWIIKFQNPGNKELTAFLGYSFPTGKENPKQGASFWWIYRKKKREISRKRKNCNWSWLRHFKFCSPGEMEADLFDVFKIHYCYHEGPAQLFQALLASPFGINTNNGLCCGFSRQSFVAEGIKKSSWRQKSFRENSLL